VHDASESSAPNAPAMLPHEEEEVPGLPSFELVLRDGEPIVSGSYFLYPPLRAVEAEWDASQPSRLLVRADDGTWWAATDVPRTGRVNVVLEPVGEHPLFARARAVAHLAGESEH
jgi:hypothetical protein